MDFVPYHDPGRPALNAWAGIINKEAGRAFPPCLVAAVMNRETGGANVFQKGMPKGPGCGVGLMQITSSVDWSNVDDPMLYGYHLMRPEDNIHCAVAFYLVPALIVAARLQQNDPQGFEAACHGQLAYGVAAAYNAGPGALQKAVAGRFDVDTLTTNDYASDVFDTYVAMAGASHLMAGAPVAT